MTLTSYDNDELKNEDILDIVKSGLFVQPFWYKVMNTPYNIYLRNGHHIIYLLSF